jgi:hypothetical protein
MKFLNSFLWATLLVLSVACNKQVAEPCDTGNLEAIIVGKWTINFGGSSAGDVEFKSDGTLIDPDDVLLGFTDIQDQKSYVVDSNTEFTATAIDNGSSLEVAYDVTSFTCDEIILDFFGFEVKMNRK